MHETSKATQRSLASQITKQAMQRDIESLRACHTSKNALVQDVKNDIDQQEPQLCLINKVPTELMQRILEDVMDLDRPEAWRFKFLCRLSLVQKSWKAITNLSVFWPTLWTGDSPLIHNRAIEINPDSPLHFVFYEYTREDGNMLKTLPLMFLSASKARHRWRGFHWHGSMDSWRIVVNQLTLPTPHLQDLCLQAYPSHSWPRLPELSDGCELRRLWSSNVALPWRSARFRNLQSLYIKSFRTEYGPTFQDLINMLSSSPSLGELVLGGSFRDSTLINLDIVHLPLLKFVVLDIKYPTSSRFLNRIRANTCRSLFARITDFAQFEDPTSPLSETIGSVLRRHTGSLKLHYQTGPESMLLSTECDPSTGNFWEGARTEGLHLTLFPPSKPAGDQASWLLPLASQLNHMCPIDIKFGIKRGADSENMCTPDLVEFLQHLRHPLTLSMESDFDPQTCTNIFLVSNALQ